MANKKKTILDNVREGDRVGKAAVDSGKELKEDGSEIKALLDSIDTTMDVSDVAAVRSAETAYDSDFKAAFAEDVEATEDEMEAIENEAADSAEEEQEKVEDAGDKFTEMAGVTDVGRRNANGAADRMKRSAAEYEELTKDATSVVEETKKEVDALKRSVDSIFE